MPRLRVEIRANNANQDLALNAEPAESAEQHLGQRPVLCDRRDFCVRPIVFPSPANDPSDRGGRVRVMDPSLR
jgi:hypothetical protein